MATKKCKQSHPMKLILKSRALSFWVRSVIHHAENKSSQSNRRAVMDDKLS
jgi:hypothetical protein